MSRINNINGERTELVLLEEYYRSNRNECGMYEVGFIAEDTNGDQYQCYGSFQAGADEYYIEEKELIGNSQLTNPRYDYGTK